MKADLAALKARVNAIEARPVKPLKDLSWCYPQAETSRHWVAVEIARLAGIEPDYVRPTQRLTDSGIDALARVELALELETLLHLAVQLDSSGWVTVDDVLQTVLRTPTTARPPE